MKLQINPDDWTDYLISKGLADRTISEYLNYFNKLDLENFDQRYVIKIVNQYNGNPVLKATLKSVIHFIRINEFPKEIKASISEIEIPKTTGTKKKKVKEVLSKTQIHMISREMRNNRDRLMILVSFYGGLRCGELLSIRPYDFNWQNWLNKKDGFGDLKVTGKGDKQRIVWIPPIVMENLYLWIREQNKKSKKALHKDKPLFKVRDRTWRKVLSNASYKAIKRRINTHLLRDSCATYLLDQGLNLMEIKEYLGHENIQTTQVYLHVHKGKLKEKVMEAVISH